MKLKQSKTKKANLKPSKTRKVDTEVVAKSLEAEIIECDNCHNFDGKHAKHCYKGSKNIENVIFGPINFGLNWNLPYLKNKENLNIEFKTAYDRLWNLLNRIVIVNDIDLPEPNVEWVEDALNLSWFSQTAQMALSFSLEKENNEFVIHMSYLCDNKATDIYNPSNEQIVEKLKAFKFWKHIMEIKNIISETDPRKFPNTISDKKLSSEEKLEFIGEILSELRMDFSDADHQIDCHADTLAVNFRDVMNALNKIHNITCMSVEEIENMEFGKH